MRAPPIDPIKSLIMGRNAIIVEMTNAFFFSDLGKKTSTLIFDKSLVKHGERRNGSRPR